MRLRARPQGVADSLPTGLRLNNRLQFGDAWIARIVEMGERPADEHSVFRRYPEAGVGSSRNRIYKVLDALSR